MRKRLFFIPILLLLFTVAHAEDQRWEQAPKETKQKKDQKGTETQTLPPLQEEQQQTMMKILKKPPIPIKAPDKIIRILFLPYVDKNNILNNYRYSFLKVDEGNWVLGDYLLEPARLDKKVFNPLDNPGERPQQQQQQSTKQKQQTKAQKLNQQMPNQQTFSQPAPNPQLPNPNQQMLPSPAMQQYQPQTK